MIDLDDFSVLSTRPRIYHYPALLSPSECDELAAHTTARLRRTVIRSISQYKASQCTADARTLSRDEERHAVVAKIKRRVSRLVKLPVEHLENLLVQRCAL